MGRVEFCPRLRQIALPRRAVGNVQLPASTPTTGTFGASEVDRHVAKLSGETRIMSAVQFPIQDDPRTNPDVTDHQDHEVTQISGFVDPYLRQGGQVAVVIRRGRNSGTLFDLSRKLKAGILRQSRDPQNLTGTGLDQTWNANSNFLKARCLSGMLFMELCDRLKQLPHKLTRVSRRFEGHPLRDLARQPGGCDQRLGGPNAHREYAEAVAV